MRLSLQLLRPALLGLVLLLALASAATAAPAGGSGRGGEDPITGHIGAFQDHENRLPGRR
jgi:hypothetical protein